MSLSSNWEAVSQQLFLRTEGRRSSSSTVFTILATALLAYLVGSVTYAIFLHPLRAYPGPTFSKVSRIPWWIVSLTGNQVRWVHGLHSRYGPVVRYNPDELSYADGRAWNDIYGFARNRPENPKDLRHQAPPKNGVRPLLSANDAEHAKVRRMLAPAFSDRALKQQEHIFKKYADMLVSKICQSLAQDPDKPLDMVQYINFTTFDVMAELTFGEPLGLLEGSKYTPWVAGIVTTFKSAPFMIMLATYPTLDWLFRTLEPEFVKKFRLAHDRHTQDRVDKRLARGSTQPDFWNLVVTDEGESELTVGEMYVNAEVFMFAGTETTATLLSGLVYYLLLNPDKMKKLKDEIRGTFKTGENITFEQLAKLRYMYACIQETLRIYPPVPSALPRLTPKEGNIICGQFVPAGTAVSVHHTSMYRNPDNFKNPNKFAPERWLGAHDYADDHLDALQPFHIGPRNCLGQNMAQHEVRLLLATLLYNFDLELCEESSEWADQNVYLLWEKKPLMCKLKRISVASC